MSKPCRRVQASESIGLNPRRAAVAETVGYETNRYHELARLQTWCRGAMLSPFGRFDGALHRQSPFGDHGVTLCGAWGCRRFGNRWPVFCLFGWHNLEHRETAMNSFNKQTADPPLAGTEK